MPRATKTRDLGLQELQKNIIKSAQPMLLLFDTVDKAKADKKAIQPIVILPMLDDAVTLIGHASYLASLKRREFLKTEFLLRISLFVVNLIQSLHFCSVMNYPNISRILAK